MKTVVLCGGKGTRYDMDKPKVLAPIGNIPIIEHVMEIYSRQGYKDFILATGWKGDYIIDHFKDSNKNNRKYMIEFVDTGELTNTGKRIKLIENFIPKKDKTFLCTYADGIANVNIHNLRVHHLISENIGTITVVRPYNQFGVVKIDKDGQILSFEEKPRMADYTNGGFFMFDKKIFEYIDNNDELEVQVFNRLVKENKLGAYKHEGFWDTINTPKDEMRLNNIYNTCEDPEWFKIF